MKIKEKEIYQVLIETESDTQYTLKTGKEIKEFLESLTEKDFILESENEIIIIRSSSKWDDIQNRMFENKICIIIEERRGENGN